MLRRLFRITERGATVGGEVRGGVVTFVTMAYIVVLNPLILGSVDPASASAKRDLLGATLSVPQVAAVTALVAGVMTILFGLVANFFDAMGTMTGLGRQAGLLDEHGRLPRIGRALVVEGLGAVAGGAASSSSNTVFVESASGIASGARTGLANVVTGVLFLAAMFFTPLYQVVPVEAAAPALVVVGALMMGGIRDIEWSDFSVALPVFLTVVVMPFTYSIADGIGTGFITWVVLHTATGRARTIHPLMWVVAVAFLAYFAVGPLRTALGG